MKHRLSRALAPLLLVAAAVAVVASTASMLAGLRHAFGRKRREPSERQRVHDALKPLLADIDWAEWDRTFGTLAEDFDEEAFLRSLPVLDPPLSRTIIDERNDP